MATLTTKQIVLPIPSEFIRHVTDVIIQHTKNEEDVTTETIPIVSRAKTLVSKTGIIITTFERESDG